MQRSCVLEHCACDRVSCHLTQWRPSWGTEFSVSSKICKCHFSPSSYSLASKNFVLFEGAKPLLIETEILKNRIALLEKSLAESQAALAKQKQLFDEFKNNLEKVLTSDQIKIIQQTNIRAYSQDTLEKALAVKLHCGSSGYEFMRDFGYPLPTINTLLEKINKIKLRPGYLHEITELMAKEATVMADNERHAVLVIDEMAIQPAVNFNTTLGTITGLCHPAAMKDDCPDDFQQWIADKVLVIMVKFISLKVKQPVAYYFTNRHLDGKKLAGLIENTAVDLEASTGIRIHGIVTDMGGKNQQAMNALCTSSVNCEPSRQHWLDEHRRFFVFYDSTHQLKNLRNMLETKSPIKSHFGMIDYAILDLLVQKHGGSITYGKRKLTISVLHPTGFKKMRVWPAAIIFSSETAALLAEMSNDNELTEAVRANAKSLSQFVSVVAAWWEAVACTDPFKAQQQVSLNAMVDMMRLTSESKHPCSKAIYMTCKAIPQLNDMLGQQYGDSVKFKTANILADCIENFFSQLRSQSNANPAALQVYYNIKLAILCNYERHSVWASYPDAGDKILISLKSMEPLQDVEPSLHMPESLVIPQLDDQGMRQLWHKIKPYIEKIIVDSCHDCTNLVLLEDAACPSLIAKLEPLFVKILPKLTNETMDVRVQVYDYICERFDIFDADCRLHNLYCAMINRYISFRLLSLRMQITDSNSHFGSRSVFRYATQPNP